MDILYICQGLKALGFPARASGVKQTRIYALCKVQGSFILCSPARGKDANDKNNVSSMN